MKDPSPPPPPPPLRKDPKAPSLPPASPSSSSSLSLSPSLLLPPSSLPPPPPLPTTTRRRNNPIAPPLPPSTCSPALGLLRDKNKELPEYRKPAIPYSAFHHSPYSSSADAMDPDMYRMLQAGNIDDLKKETEDCWLRQLTPQQNTPLHIAARKGLDLLIKDILNLSPRLLSQTNFNKELALHIAAREGHLTAVKRIAESAGKVKNSSVFMMGNKDGDTALHLAVRHKHKEVAQHLIQVCPQASYHLNNKTLKSPIYVAVELGNLDLVRTMVESPVEDSVKHLHQKDGKSVLLAAISGGNPGLLGEILCRNKGQIFQFLISPGKFCGHDPCLLASAVAKGNPRMVKNMLWKFPDCIYKRSNDGIFPIHVAALTGNKMVVEEFLRFRPDSKELLSSHEENILHIAAAQGKDDVVRYILRKLDLDDLINARDSHGNTPLHRAVAAKSPMVVNALTWDTRVKLDLVNNDGNTARDMALDIGNSLPSLKEQLIWMALRYAGAPRFIDDNRTKKQRMALRYDDATGPPFIYDERTNKPLNTNNFKDQVNTLSVVAALVVTVTFAAGFTLPGGNSDSEPHLGMANFLKKRIFQLFVISNSIALYTSMLDVLILIFAMLGDMKLLHVSLKLATPMLALSLAMMSLSFMSAAYLVVSALKWLGIVIWVVGSIFLALVLALFVLLSPPVSAKNRFARYIVYVPYRALLYISEGK